MINRTKQPDLSEILKAIGIQGLTRGKVGSPPSVPPPPLPPTALEEGRDKPWSQPPLLPPKFPTWGQNSWPDTPASPPLYEKTGYASHISDTSLLNSNVNQRQTFKILCLNPVFFLVVNWIKLLWCCISIIVIVFMLRLYSSHIDQQSRWVPIIWNA